MVENVNSTVEPNACHTDSPSSVKRERAVWQTSGEEDNLRCSLASAINITLSA